MPAGMRLPILPAVAAAFLAGLLAPGTVPAMAETQIAALPRPIPQQVILPPTKPKRVDASHPCGGEGFLPYRQAGRAHYYGARHQGLPTASGEPFDMHGMTAAHLTLPLGTKVRVTNLRNGRSVVVRINDRHARNTPKVIDLSRQAADRLGFRRAGVTRVRLAAVCGS